MGSISVHIIIQSKFSTNRTKKQERQMWNLRRQVKDQGVTIVLTTHYIEEAEALCARVALINRGRLQKLDSPVHLIEELGPFAVDEIADETLKSRYFHDRDAAIALLSKAGDGAALRATTLEDVFVDCAGRKL